MRRSGWLITMFFLAGAQLGASLPAHAGEWRYFGSVGGHSPAATTTLTDAPPAIPPMGQIQRKSAAPGNLPGNNMTMEAVAARFGPPDTASAPVGTPAIVRWYYAAYTVYFEIDRVITSVVN